MADEDDYPYVIEIEWHREPGQVTDRTYYLAPPSHAYNGPGDLELTEYMTTALEFDNKASAEVVAFMVGGRAVQRKFH